VITSNFLFQCGKGTGAKYTRPMSI